MVQTVQVRPQSVELFQMIASTPDVFLIGKALEN